MLFKFRKRNEPISRREEKYHPAKGRGDEVLGGVSAKSLIKTGTTGDKGVDGEREGRCNRNKVNREGRGVGGDAEVRRVFII